MDAENYNKIVNYMRSVRDILSYEDQIEFFPSYMPQERIPVNLQDVVDAALFEEYMDQIQNEPYTRPTSKPFCIDNDGLKAVKKKLEAYLQDKMNKGTLF